MEKANAKTVVDSKTGVDKLDVLWEQTARLLGLEAVLEAAEDALHGSTEEGYGEALTRCIEASDALRAAQEAEFSNVPELDGLNAK